MKKSKNKININRIQKRHFTVLIIGIALTVFIMHSCINDKKNKPTKNLTTKVSASKSVKKPKTQIDDLSRLKNQLEKQISEYSGDWSVYVKNLDTGQSFAINSHPVYAASTIKLFALAAAYQQIFEGYITEDEIYDTLFNMAANSNNESFNSVVWTLGKYYITDWCKRNNYDDTNQCHGLYPSSNGDGLETSNGYNMTSVTDLGKILEDIYYGRCVSEKYSKKMLNILFHQKYRDKIPKGIPSDVPTANKTGETDDVSHDCAIVYSDGADYIISVMVVNEGHAWENFDQFQYVSSKVYSYFNNIEKR